MFADETGLWAYRQMARTSSDPMYYSLAELSDLGFRSVGENVRIAKHTCRFVNPHNISIGDHSRIDDHCTIVASGPLTIGRRVHIHSYCQIGSRGGVTFDDYSSIASACLVYSASDDPLGRFMIGGAVPQSCTRPKVAPVRFRRHSGAFARCTILPGVTFEEGSIACAHSLVTRSVPEWTVVAGTPAVHRIHRSRKLLALEGLVDWAGPGAP